MRTLIIAEPGSTHEGDYDTMVKLIAVAAAVGCDVYKGQWTSSAETMCRRRHAKGYIDSYRKLQYPLAWHAQLRNACQEHGLQYGCTAYSPVDFKAVAPFVDFLKVSSFEVGSRKVLNAAFRCKRRVIVSTGMLNGYEPVLPTLERFAMPWAVLHCCSAYPAPLDGLNIAAMKAGLRPSLNGFSDHSRDVRVGAWAVCAGAEVIETHFRLDDCDPVNRDYAVAFTPAELKLYVQNVRDAELALGDGVKKIEACEGPMLRYRVVA